jgi:hypothetical protein
MLVDNEAKSAAIGTSRAKSAKTRRELILARVYHGEANPPGVFECPIVSS